MNTYARRFTANRDDPLVGTWIGWKRAKDRRLVFGLCAAVVLTYTVVYLSEERQKTRRHTSIEKDIARERWRAQQLGLGKPSDDGFAEDYLEQAVEEKNSLWFKFVKKTTDGVVEEDDLSWGPASAENPPPAAAAAKTGTKKGGR